MRSDSFFYDFVSFFQSSAFFLIGFGFFECDVILLLCFSIESIHSFECHLCVIFLVDCFVVFFFEVCDGVLIVIDYFLFLVLVRVAFLSFVVLELLGELFVLSGDEGEFALEILVALSEEFHLLGDGFHVGGRFGLLQLLELLESLGISLQFSCFVL